MMFSPRKLGLGAAGSILICRRHRGGRPCTKRYSSYDGYYVANAGRKARLTWIELGLGRNNVDSPRITAENVANVASMMEKTLVH